MCPRAACREGQALAKRDRGTDMLDAVLARNDTPGLALRTIYDPYNDEELTISKEELRVLMNIQQGKMPDVAIDPHEDLVDWYSNTVDPHPMQNAPEPKRRFAPSKWEDKKIVKLVRGCALVHCCAMCAMRTASAGIVHAHRCICLSTAREAFVQLTKVSNDVTV
jgi:hypothetical protein